MQFIYKPRAEEIHVQFKSEDLSIHIVDMAGRVIKTMSGNSSLLLISVADIQVGEYAVMISGGRVAGTYMFVKH